MSRPDCPKKNTFPNGCRWWSDEGENHGKGSCKFDITEMQDGYGPFYVTTRCCRLGNANQPDRYEPTDDYAKVVAAIDWDALARRSVGQPYEHDDRWLEVRNGFFEAAIAHLSQLVNP